MSEQISTAGKEASGTGNMKFMLNGALTIGTLDGANVEIREEAGAENFFLFGLTAAEVERVKREGYDPARYRDGNAELREALDLVGGGHFSRGDRTMFRPLVENLLRSRPLPGAGGLCRLRGVPGAGQRGLERSKALDPDVDSQHGARGQVLVRPRDTRVLRPDLGSAGRADRDRATAGGR